MEADFSRDDLGLPAYDPDCDLVVYLEAKMSDFLKDIPRQIAVWFFNRTVFAYAFWSENFLTAVAKSATVGEQPDWVNLQELKARVDKISTALGINFYTGLQTDFRVLDAIESRLKALEAHHDH